MRQAKVSRAAPRVFRFASVERAVRRPRSRYVATINATMAVVAINIAHRRDLDERVEWLAARLGLRGRGRKTAIIERALAALEEQLEQAEPDVSTILASLDRLTQAGDDYRECAGERATASLAWEDQLYDEHGLPK